MDSISPLAKILAEANGIDWRSIQGSGQGGSVVEQDILNYLSRVMSGDEEPPATPVDDLPEGWTGEMPPMPVNPSGLEALKAAGVESDITDFVDQQAQAAMPQVAAYAVAAQPGLAQAIASVPVTEMPAADLPAADLPAAEPVVIRPVLPEAVVMAAPVAGPSDAAHHDDLDADSEFELDDLNEDDLELDDLESGGAPDWSQAAHAQPAVQVPNVQVQHAYDPVEADPEADFVMADTHTAGSAPADSHGADSAGHSLPADPYGLGTPAVAPVHDAYPAAMHADSTQPQIEASQIEALQVEQAPVEQAPVAAPANVAFAAPVPPIPEVSVPEISEPEQEMPVEAAAAVATGAAGFGLGGFLSRLYGNRNAAEPSEPVVSEPVVSEPAYTQPPSPEPLVAEYAEPTIGTVHAEPFVAPAAEPAEPVADQWRGQEPAVSRYAEPQQPIALPEAHEAEQSVEDQVVAESSATESPVTELAVTELAATELPATESQATGPAEPEHADVVAAVSEAVPVPAGATTLRLNVDLSALETARAQLSEALYRDVPLPLLVARAAARSAGTLGLNGPVALGTHAGQALAADLSGDFRASLDDLKRHADAQPALLVLDAAELGLDELHRGACSLSLGRSAAGQAALSLRGDIDPVHGAQFLHEVAGLLDTPIRLLF